MPVLPVSPGPGEVYALIRARGAITRADIGQWTGLSRTAVTARLAPLLDAGLVTEVQPAASTGGRPATLLTVNATAGVVLAAAVGRSRVRLAVCDLAGAILALDDVDQGPGRGPRELMPEVVTRSAALLADSGHGQCPVYGVGLSLPGSVDQRRGCTIDSPVMTGWDGVALPPYFADLTGAPVVLDNDANVIALAERRADRPPVDDLLVVKASTGLGAGIIAGGALQRGAAQAAGEFGHNKTPAADGIACRCGDSGCLEAVAGGWALVRALREQGRDVTHLREVIGLAHGGDAEARRLIRDSGRHVGQVMAAAVNLLNPAELVVAGDMVEAYDIFVAGLRESLYGYATALATRTLQVLPAAFGDRSGVIGSAMVVLDHVLNPTAIAERVRRADALTVGRAE
ncbi:ROK family transcriptional regulator [Mycobacterium sp. PS03-16]|uniref:ROK family transcriptional regulator n=1 Tax=Mycobacterium sp. PS03-16 TaxID=2559611 RepID=UPI0010733D81|nr:ROK family transcriptional regulator [Mycobacterium sp. PS03-16]TFV61134.1 ROK family transcriptional regulator [Mycobacterium sp. PS03-16]